MSQNAEAIKSRPLDGGAVVTLRCHLAATMKVRREDRADMSLIRIVDDSNEEAEELAFFPEEAAHLREILNEEAGEDPADLRRQRDDLAKALRETTGLICTVCGSGTLAARYTPAAPDPDRPGGYWLHTRRKDGPVVNAVRYCSATDIWRVLAAEGREP